MPRPTPLPGALWRVELDDPEMVERYVFDNVLAATAGEAVRCAACAALALNGDPLPSLDAITEASRWAQVLPWPPDQVTWRVGR